MIKSIIAGARGLSTAAAAGLAFAALTGAVPAHAEWLKAESERFIVYSEGSEASLRRYVQHLDTYDRILHISLSNSMGEPPPRKLPVDAATGEASVASAARPSDRGAAPPAVPEETGVMARFFVC